MLSNDIGGDCEDVEAMHRCLEEGQAKDVDLAAELEHVDHSECEEVACEIYCSEHTSNPNKCSKQ